MDQTTVYSAVTTRGTVIACTIIICISTNVIIPGASALRAQESLEANFQQFLPRDQWRLELGNWFAASLARLQLGVARYAVGPTSIVPGMTVINPNSGDLGAAMCKQQLSKTTAGTVSFSILGIVIVFVVGGFIMILSFVLEAIVASLQTTSSGVHTENSIGSLIRSFSFNVWLTRRVIWGNGTVFTQMSLSPSWRRLLVAGLMLILSGPPLLIPVPNRQARQVLFSLQLLQRMSLNMSQK